VPWHLTGDLRLGNDMSDQSKQQKGAKLAELKLEHRDLDRVIETLERQGGDALQIQRLKKRKLALKDQILKMEDQSLPDIIA